MAPSRSSIQFLLRLWSANLFSSCLANVNGMTGDQENHTGKSSPNLAYFPPRVHHTYGCVNMGIWNGSCDINTTMSNEDTMQQPAIVSLTDWSERCDPWKGVTETKTLKYKEDSGVWVDINDGTSVKTGWTAQTWTCPEDQRSMSGCGDFRADTRNLTAKCTQRTSLFQCGRPYDSRSYGADDIPIMLVPQRHACIQHPIFYDNLGQYADQVLPPPVGRHRERWAKWGEYDYLPPHRWLHNNEHGGVIFLYHQCLEEASLCALRRYIQKWQQRIGSIPWKRNGNDDADAFRFILTPFKDLSTPIAMVMWGHVYTSKCFNQHDMDRFIEKWYRTAYEDWPPNGPYDYLWKDISQTAASCAVLPDAGSVASSQLLTAQQKEHEELRALVTTLSGQVARLQSEMASIKDVCKNNGTNGRLLANVHEPCYGNQPAMGRQNAQAMSHSHRNRYLVGLQVLAACVLRELLEM